MNVREIAFSALLDTFESNKYSNIELDNVIKTKKLNEKDKSFFTAIYLGVIEKKITIDYIISRFSSIPRNEIELSVLTLLEIGVYQILYMDRIPDSASVSESVEIAKRSFPRSQGFVNAILRKIADSKDLLDSMLDFSGKKGMSLKYSLPKWLCKSLITDYGDEKAEEIMREMNVRPPLTIRINELKISKTDYLSKLSENGIEFYESDISKEAVILKDVKNPRDIFGFDEGFFFVQDASPQYAVELLGIKPLDTVIDVCAAPGGKSFSAAVMMKNKGKIIAFDLYQNRVKMIRDVKEKLGIGIIFEEQNDSTKIKEEYVGICDKVICDVPCSGYGVISKKPDIRLKSENESMILPMIQSEILNSSANYLKIGGKLLYSTCTLSKSENECIVDAFLNDHDNFKRTREPETVFPRGKYHDGFYIDIIERVK